LAILILTLRQRMYEQVGIYDNSGPIASVIFPDLVVEHTDIFR
jgi:hypothetical protein